MHILLVGSKDFQDYFIRRMPGGTRDQDSELIKFHTDPETLRGVDAFIHVWYDDAVEPLTFKQIDQIVLVDQLNRRYLGRYNGHSTRNYTDQGYRGGYPEAVARAARDGLEAPDSGSILHNRGAIRDIFDEIDNDRPQIGSIAQ